MTREIIATAIRTILTVLGSFLIGRQIFGVEVDANWIQTVIGVVLTLVSVVWGIADKTMTLERWESFVRQVFSFVSGILIAKGTLTPEKAELYIGVIGVVFTVIASLLSKKKSEDLATGQAKVVELKTLSSSEEVAKMKVVK